MTKPQPETLSNGSRIIRRYRNGRCYAAVFSADTSDRQIYSAMATGFADFFPYNESSGEFLWHLTSRPSHFKA